MNSNKILGANQRTHKFEFSNPSNKFQQFLKISLKFYQILLIFEKFQQGKLFLI
jgi:hypothetical protein